MKPMVKCSKCARMVEVERKMIVNGTAPCVLCRVCEENDLRDAEREMGVYSGYLDEEE